MIFCFLAIQEIDFEEMAFEKLDFRKIDIQKKEFREIGIRKNGLSRKKNWENGFRDFGRLPFKNYLVMATSMYARRYFTN